MFPTSKARAVVSLAASLLSILCISLTTACSRLETPEQQGELVVGIRQTPAFFQQDESGPSGYEYDLAAAFAAELGVKLRIVTAKNPEELTKLLEQGKIHFAASMPISDEAPTGANIIRYTTPLREARFVVVHNADRLGLDEISDLSGKAIELTARSPVVAALEKLPAESRPQITTWAEGDEQGLIERLAAFKTDLIATDSLHFAIATNFYPELRVGFELPGRLRLGWGFVGADNPLFDKAQDFIKRIQEDGTLARVDDRYFGHIRRINEAGISQFLDDMQKKLPQYRRDFYSGQEATGIDWRLIAALAYQESKWDPLATSFTGVRGMMMLTGDTADRLGVSNRLDAKQSIRAGAKYLADLSDELPEEVQEPDRMWISLAAYNLGMGHMNGARAIAEGLNRDPNSWFEMKKVLPLLARPEYYARLKSGKARGGEAVIMVENIRTYFDILSRFEPAYQPALALKNR